MKLVAVVMVLVVMPLPCVSEEVLGQFYREGTVPSGGWCTMQRETIRLVISAGCELTEGGWWCDWCMPWGLLTVDDIGTVLEANAQNTAYFSAIVADLTNGIREYCGILVLTNATLTSTGCGSYFFADEKTAFSLGQNDFKGATITRFYVELNNLWYELRDDGMGKAHVAVTWTVVGFPNLTPIEKTTWGRIKALYPE